MGTTSSINQKTTKQVGEVALTIYTSQASENNKKIEKEIAIERKKGKTLMKILCLGTSCSGKSTILKQMRIIHLDGFDKEEKTVYCDSFLLTFVSSANELLSKLPEALLTDEIKIAQKKVEALYHISAQSLRYHADVLMEIRRFFKSSQGEEIIEKFGRGQQCGNFIKYFLDRMGSVEELHDFLPTTADILRIRVQTTGVAFTNFNHRNAQFSMIDVGGQKTERRKWIHFFDDVKAIFFVVDISNFADLEESLEVFTGICATKSLMSASVILFFNKTDIFREKKNLQELVNYFPEFIETSCNHKEAGKFIQRKFEERFRKHKKAEIYSFFTCATDTRNIDKTFSACSDIILKKNLVAAGLY